MINEICIKDNILIIDIENEEIGIKYNDYKLVEQIKYLNDNFKSVSFNINTGKYNYKIKFTIKINQSVSNFSGIFYLTEIVNDLNTYLRSK